MRELRIPTRRIAVELFATDGVAIQGWMYHPESLYERGTAEDVASELNDERDFVPFETRDATAQTMLLNKRHIVRVRVSGLTGEDLRPDEVLEARRARRCSVWLDDGSRVTGRPVIETPGRASRLVDKFNHCPTFLTFLADDGVDFIHRIHVVRILRDT